MSSQQEQEISAAQQVFDTAELKEVILLNSDPIDILDHLHQDASLQRAVEGSLVLKQKLHLIQLPEIPVTVPPNTFAHKVAIGEPSPLLFPNGTKSFSFRLAKDGPVYEVWFVPSVKGMRYKYNLTRDSCDRRKNIKLPILPPCYLATHFTDRAIPIVLNVQFDEDLTDEIRKGWLSKGYCARYDDRDLYLPPGKTLGDAIHWLDLLSADALKSSDDINDIRQFDLHYIHGEPKTQERIRREQHNKKRGVWTLRMDGTWVKPLPRDGVC